MKTFFVFIHAAPPRSTEPPLLLKTGRGDYYNTMKTEHKRAEQTTTSCLKLVLLIIS